MVRNPSDSGGVVPAKNAKENLEALKIVRRYVDEGSEDSARTERLERNKENYREFRGDKDWSHKSRGQSMEHLPKMRMAFEQLSAIFKKALVDLGGSWYDIEVQGDPVPGVTGVHLRKLMNAHLLSNDINFPTKISDAVKQAGLESLMIMKVYGKYVPKRQFVAQVVGAELVNDLETGLPLGISPRFELKPNDQTVWRLAADLIPTEDYIPDPDGLGLYEIHEVTRDLWQVREMAERGIYDIGVVDKIVAHMTDEKDRKRQAEDARGKRTSRSGASKRKKVRVSEVWAILVDEDGKMINIKTDTGKVKARNTVTTLVDGRFMVRAPSRNPSWSGLRPMVAAPLIRTPHSVWHDALGDYVRSLNNAIDELFNLMLDAGIKGVWGISQIRPEMLLDEDQISEGIPPQETLVLRPGVPQDVDVYKRVDTGTNMGESLSVMNLIMSQFHDAVMVNQIGVGQLPQRQVKATEITMAAQSMGNLFDGITRDMEDSFIEPTLERAFHLVMQHLNEMDVDEVVAAVGTKVAIILLSLTPEERFALFSNRVKFRVTGLSSAANRAREFQKILAILEVMSSNPTLGMIFARKYSLAKVVDRLVRAIDIDPESLGVIDEAEAQAQVALLKTYIESQRGAVKTGQEFKMPEMPSAGEGLPGELPSSVNQAPGNLPPGIEGGGGMNEFEGQSLARRTF